MKPLIQPNPAAEAGSIERSVGNLSQGTVQDITHHREISEELEDLALIAKQSYNPVIVIDIDGNITWVNNAFVTKFGYPLREAIGKKPGMLLDGPETDPATVRYLREKMEKKEPFECELVKYAKSGQKYWMRVQGQPIFDEMGRCTKFFTIQNDITERKIAQERIKASEREYRYLFHQNPMPMWIFDQETLYFIEVNEAAILHYGYSAEEFLKMRITDIRPGSDIPKLEKALKTLFRSEDIRKLSVWTHIKKTGELLFAEITSHNIDYRGRKAVLVLANDVTEKILIQKKLDGELILKQREITEAVVEAQEKERLDIGRELHDNVNQLLGAIKLYLTSIRECRGELDSLLNRSVDLVSRSIEEVRKLSKALAGPAMENLHLYSAVESLVEEISATGSVNIIFDKEEFYEADLSKKVKLNIFRIIQEQFNNILKHAHASEIYVSLHRTPQNIYLMIQDNGQGFDLSRKRNGIGIGNIFNRAGLNNGKVSIISSPGMGCRLQVEFAIAIPQRAPSPALH